MTNKSFKNQIFSIKNLFANYLNDFFAEAAAYYCVPNHRNFIPDIFSCVNKKHEKNK